jgi:transcription-repair coupling factor (superfamily II helicase)
LTAFEAELKDRFGELPQVVKELIQVVRLRHIGMRSGIEKMTLRKGKLTAYLLSNFESNFYQSEIFNKMLVYAVENPRNTLFKEENGKRTLTLLNIGGVQEAYDCFMQMQ